MEYTLRMIVKVAYWLLSVLSSFSHRAHYFSFLIGFCFSKSKVIREREEQKLREEEPVAQPPSGQEEGEEPPAWQPPLDEGLQRYIEDVRNTIQSLNNTKEQVIALAR